MTGENLPFSPQISAYKSLVRPGARYSYIRNTISEIKKWRRLHSSPCLDRRGCCLSCLVMSCLVLSCLVLTDRACDLLTGRFVDRSQEPRHTVHITDRWCGKRLLSHCFIQKRSFCQDRLGTDTGKVEGKRVFSAGR